MTEARKTGRNLRNEIAECQWPVVCIDPEHLTAKEWEYITDTDVFRENVTFVCVDEAHLINIWGIHFRPAFRHIGAFIRGRLPQRRLSVIALSASLQPGLPTESICKSLGFFPGTFYTLRRTNERPNIQFLMSALSHGLGGNEFPDILPYLAANRKTIIYCGTIEMCWRVAVYLWRSLPPGPARLKCVRLYHAMCWPDENEETVRLIRDDSQCQVVIATIAFGQGFNIKPLLDSIQLGVASSLDQTIQQAGRVGRDFASTARAVVFVQGSALKAAKKYLHGEFPISRCFTFI